MTRVRLFEEQRGACALIGMVHTLPLPGSPEWGGSIAAIVEGAERDASRLVAGGCDALIVENMGDLPYLRGRVEPESVAAMSVVASALARWKIPFGVQMLAGANREALGIALASGATFVRVEGYAYGHVADEGWIEACAGPLARTRACLGAKVAFWADVRKKHAAHSVTRDISFSDLAKGHVFCGAEVLIVTGTCTGSCASVADVKAARSAGVPVVVGSGVDAGNVAEFAPYCDGVIVGTSLKEDGDWRRPVDVQRVKALRLAMDRVA